MGFFFNQNFKRKNVFVQSNCPYGYQKENVETSSPKKNHTKKQDFLKIWYSCLHIWFQTESSWRFEGSLHRAPTPFCDALDVMSKTCHNFFFYWSDIVEKCFGKKKTFSFVYFCQKHFVSLSVSHKISSHLANNILFLRKKSILFAKCDEISWETDKLTKGFVKNRQTECFILTKTFFDDIRPIEKKIYDRFSTWRHRRGGKSSSSD